MGGSRSPRLAHRSKLTLKQQAFVIWYTTPGDTLFNATKAAGRAGYKGNLNTLHGVGSENIRKPAINREINRVLSEAFQSVELTVEKVISDLEFHRRLAIRNQDIAGANQALQMQGKYLKMFADRVEHVHSVEDATEDELVALLNELTDKIDGINVPRSVAVSRGRGSGDGEDPHSEGAPTTH